MNLQFAKRAGFTLIEVMIVVAIMGVIIAGATIGVTQSRDNAQDRFIAEQLGVIRLEAEMSYKNNARTYTDVCTDVQTYLSEISSSNKHCLAGPDGYAVSIEKSSGLYYCVDNATRQPHDNLATSTIGATGSCSSGSTVDCSCG